jgi:hypothetical protein
LSSTILYLAIVAIWAGVLVPRWLRREPHRETSVHSHHVDGGAADVPAEADRAYARPAPPAVAERGGRARVMTARRRLFCILVALTVAAVVAATAGLATWWVAVPPVGMLAGYVLLLREAARADAELRATRADRADRAGHRRVSARPAAGPVAPAAGQGSSTAADTAGAAVPGDAASATAEVVDLMSRVDGELYDQYADAKLRAVGD